MERIIEALYEVLAGTEWKEDGLAALQNLSGFIDNIALDAEKGLIEFQDDEMRVTYEIRIRKTHAASME